MKMIYLASPYSHPDKAVEAFRYIVVTKIAAYLIAEHNVAMFLPITQSHTLKDHELRLKGTTFAAWRDIDLCAIDHCDEVWVVKMKGWKESVGVTAEIDHAKLTNKPIKYINAKTYMFTRSVA
jgi:hypothetical protein